MQEAVSVTFDTASSSVRCLSYKGCCSAYKRLDGVGGSGNTQRTGKCSNDSSEELPKKAEKLFAMFIGHGCGKLKG